MRVGLSIPIMGEPSALVDLGVLITGWLDELRALAAAPPYGA